MGQQSIQQQPQSQHQPHHPGIMESPGRSMHQSLPSSQMHQSSPGMNMSTLSGRQHTPSYNYQPGSMWPPPQPQLSPHPMQYGQQHTAQPQQSPMHPPAQLPHAGNNMGFPGMAAMGGNAGYNPMNRNMYQASHSPQQHYAQQGGMQGGAMQGWGQQNNAPDWQRGF